MAESFVSMRQFGEFSKRMDERFDAVDQRVNHLQAYFGKRFDAVEGYFQDKNLYVSRRRQLTQDLCELRADMGHTHRWIIANAITVFIGFGLLLLKEFLIS